MIDVHLRGVVAKMRGLEAGPLQRPKKLRRRRQRVVPGSVEVEHLVVELASASPRSTRRVVAEGHGRDDRRQAARRHSYEHKLATVEHAACNGGQGPGDDARGRWRRAAAVDAPAVDVPCLGEQASGCGIGGRRDAALAPRLDGAAQPTGRVEPVWLDVREPRGGQRWHSRSSELTHTLRTHE
eukprot:6992280-Prymnesium_polylepis.1